LFAARIEYYSVGFGVFHQRPPRSPRCQKKIELERENKHVTLRNTARAYQLFVQKQKLRETNTPSHPHLFLLLR